MDLRQLCSMRKMDKVTPEISVSNVGRFRQIFPIGTDAAVEKGGMEAQPFGDHWIETVIRRKYMEATKDSRRTKTTGRLRCTDGSMMFHGFF